VDLDGLVRHLLSSFFVEPVIAAFQRGHDQMSYCVFVGGKKLLSWPHKEHLVFSRHLPLKSRVFPPRETGASSLARI
jgi:hypothetical protein